MPLCPMATTNDGHVPGWPAAKGDMSSRADQGRPKLPRATGLVPPGPEQTRCREGVRPGGSCFVKDDADRVPPYAALLISRKQPPRT
jgi:hypothetical protein